MADNARVLSAMAALTADKWGDKVVDTIHDVMPLWNVMIGANAGSKSGAYGIGIPGAGVLITGVKEAKIRKTDILSATRYSPMSKVLTTADSDGKVLAGEDNNPVKAGWENKGPEKRFKRASFAWTMIGDPAEVSNERIEETASAAKGERNGWAAIGDLLKVERDDVLATHLKRWNALLWGTYAGTVTSTAGAPTDEDAEFWDAPYSWIKAMAATGTYAGVDRNLDTGRHWRGNTISTATNAVFSDLIRYAVMQMPLTNADGSTSKGLASKGFDLRFLCVGNDLMVTALAEAESKKGGLVIPANSPIPEMGGFGFKKKAVQIDNTIIFMDPMCPAGTVLGINPEVWTIAIHPKHNFKQTTPVDYSQTKGGDRSTGWIVDTKMLIACEAPPVAGVVWTNVS
jgi:hypothetical protein